MFKYDSTHGPYKGTIRVVDESTLEINGKQIKVSSKRYNAIFWNQWLFWTSIVAILQQIALWSLIYYANSNLLI